MGRIALVVACLAWTACGKVHTLADAGTADASTLDALVCAQSACSATPDDCCPTACNAADDPDCAATCDNGVIEPGEHCDPLASCPTACPQQGCQLYTLQGAGTCQAECVASATQGTCQNGDGCCPNGCNANNDSDCQPACGNGAVESGETCDPLTSCPSSCPQVGCQLYRLDNAGTCQAVCTPTTQQTACANGDGCCPSGCNMTNDSDCQPGCGNGVIEAGETCDPLDTCPTSCPQQGCQLYRLDNAGTCQAVCTATAQQTACVNGDGCCPGGCDATNDSDCQPSCGNGVVEPGETCDPPSSCPVCNNPYTCYTTTGSAATCDLVCDVPVTTCGIDGDSCCAFDNSTQGCDTTTDKECAGPKWQFKQLLAMDYSRGCTTHRLGGFVKGGSYLFTTCEGVAMGTGDPYLKSVIDDAGTVYNVSNDDCTAPGALPNLHGWTCKSPSGPNVMFCGPPNPGGFILPRTPAYIDVTVCPNIGGTSPFFVWFNAPSAPNDG
jgi:hypothetical protein